MDFIAFYLNLHIPSCMTFVDLQLQDSQGQASKVQVSASILGVCQACHARIGLLFGAESC